MILLFIFGLLFCISGLVNIIKTITAFTVAHSITLGLSVYDLIYLPQGTVEALIALTIVYLALEINDSDKQLKTPWLMAFSFGLLHGLGFAGALSDIGIANDQMLLSCLHTHTFSHVFRISFPVESCSARSRQGSASAPK